MSENNPKAVLNSLKQFRLNVGGNDKQLGTIPGRKRLQALQDSDSESEPTSGEIKKRKIDLTPEKKEEYFISATKLVPHSDPMDVQDALLKFDWDVSNAVHFLQQQKNVKTTDLNSRKPPPVETHDSDEEKDSLNDDDRKQNEYCKEPVYDSDDDSDEEVSKRVVSQRKAVLEFVNSATQSELVSVKFCSEKKIVAINELRPFSDWNDMKYKFMNTKVLSPDILNNFQDFLSSRNNITNIMAKCNRMIKKLEKAVASGGGITMQPTILNNRFKLSDYQMVGLNWLVIMHKEKMNGILADEMGLGKTIQVIAFLSYLKENNLARGCHLIVVPTSTLDNWANEFQRWSPTMNVERYYGNQDERRMLRTKYAKHSFAGIDVLLTTYHVVASTPEERKMFRVSKLHYVVFDEAHMLKNMTTQRYSQLSTINAEMRILLTGTPLQNNLLELMSLLCFVMPSFFAKNTEDIKNLFQKKKIAEDESSFEKSQIDQAKRIMKPFVLRRLKKDVLQHLPKKTEHIIRVPMSSSQKDCYRNLVDYYANCKGVIKGTSENAGITIMMDMRKLSNHPLLMRYYYTDDDLEKLADKLKRCPTYKSDNEEHIFTDLACLSDFQVWQIIEKHRIGNMDIPDENVLDSGKFEYLDKLLPKLKEDGHRVLIFSQFTMMLDILEEYLTIRQHCYFRLDGSTLAAERQGLIEKFNSDDDVFIFLLSTKAGGMGINLSAADTAIIHDIDFNPYNDKQAEDRCHRIGQMKPVNIYRLISEGTIEEGMFMVGQEKMKLEREITSDKSDVQEHKCMVRLLTMALGMDDTHAESLLSKSDSIANF